MHIIEIIYLYFTAAFGLILNIICLIANPNMLYVKCQNGGNTNEHIIIGPADKKAMWIRNKAFNFISYFIISSIQLLNSNIRFMF